MRPLKEFLDQRVKDVTERHAIDDSKALRHVLISGPLGAGKSTAAKFICDMFELTGGPSSTTPRAMRYSEYGTTRVCGNPGVAGTYMWLSWYVFCSILAGLDAQGVCGAGCDDEMPEWEEGKWESKKRHAYLIDVVRPAGIPRLGLRSTHS